MAIKRISQLPHQANPSLTGSTIYDDGNVTYNVTLHDLKNVITSGFTNGTSGTSGTSGATGQAGSSGTSGTSPNAHISGSNLQFGYFSGSNYITGSDLLHITNSGFTISVGNSIVNSYFPERFIVDAEGSYNIATFQTTQNESYAEVNIKNYGIGTNASADLVLWNDVATESSSYVDLGINSSNYSGGQVGFGGDGYLFNQSNDIYIGSIGEGTHGHTHLFGGNLWQSSSISIYNDGTIGINTDKFDNTASTIPTLGFAVEISGSIKLDNDLKVDGFIETGKIQGTGSLTLQPDLNDGRTIEIYNTAPSDVHIKGNAAFLFLGDDTTYVKLDSLDETIEINANSGSSINGNVNFNNDITVNGTTYTNNIRNNGQDLNINVNNLNNIGLWAEGGTINVTGSLFVNSGNITTQGYVSPSNWISGQVINMAILSASDLGFNSVYTNNTNSYTTVASGTYTPLSSSSYIFFEVYAHYEINGSGNDTWFSHITWNSIEIGYQHETWANSGGGGSRSSKLFPVTGRVINGYTNEHTFQIQTRKDNSDDTITINPDLAFYVKITEIAI